MPNTVVPLFLASVLVRCAPIATQEAHHAASTTCASSRALQNGRDHSDRLRLRPGDVAGVETDSTTRRVYFLTESRLLNFAWQVEVKARDARHVRVLTLEAVPGALFNKTDRVVSLEEECA